MDRALENLTKTSSADIIGKGQDAYKYAIYRSTRPVLIDLIDEPDDVILQNYSNIERDGSSLTGETVSSILTVLISTFL